MLAVGVVIPLVLKMLTVMMKLMKGLTSTVALSMDLLYEIDCALRVMRFDFGVDDLIRNDY